MHIMNNPLFIDWFMRSVLETSLLVSLILLVLFLFQKHITAKWRYLIWSLLALKIVLSLVPVNFSDMIPPSSKKIITNLVVSLPKPQSGVNVKMPEHLKKSERVQVVSAPTPEKRPAQAPVVENATKRTMGFSFKTALLLLWITGVVILLIRTIYNSVLMNIIKMEKPVLDSRFLGILEKCIKAMRFSTPVWVIESSKIRSPSILGFIRPRLLLPKGLIESFSDDDLELLVKHELAHIKRNDILVNWGLTLVNIFYWFNPLIWIAVDRIRQESEVICDEMVLRFSQKKVNQQYGRVIISLLEKFSVPDTVPGLVGILENRNQMKRRIIMIKNGETVNVWKTGLSTALLTVLLVLTLFTTAGFGSKNKNSNPAINAMRMQMNSTEEQGKVFLINNPKYLLLKEKTGTTAMTKDQSRGLMRQADENILKSETLWKAVEELLTLIKSDLKNDDLKAEAYYKLANVFKHHFNRGQLYRDLNDPRNCCEILLEMTRLFPQNNFWVQRAYFDLAWIYLNGDWKTQNMITYNYMKKAGPMGEIFFNYGKNELKTLADDSFLIVEGGDNQVFSLQMLLQIEKMRPDITVYDQKGNIFDDIYGNTVNSTAAQLFKKKVVADKKLIVEKTPPEDTVIKSFDDQKKALRKRSGYVYYTWPDYSRLDEINKQLKYENKPEVEYKKIGILFQIVEKGKPLQGPYNEDNIWAKYDFNWDKDQCLDYPYMIREILVNYQFQRGDYYLSKSKIEEAMQAYMEADRVGYDMVAIKFNIAIMLENNILKNAKLSDEQRKIYTDLVLQEFASAEKIGSQMYEFNRNPYDKKNAIRVIDTLIGQYVQRKNGLSDETVKKDFDNKIAQLEMKKKKYLKQQD